MITKGKKAMPTIRKALVEFRAVHYPPRPERKGRKQSSMRGDSREEIITRYVELMQDCVRRESFEEVLAVVKRMETQLKDVGEIDGQEIL